MIRTLSVFVLFTVLSAAGAVSLPDFLKGLEHTPAFRRNLQEEQSSRLALVAAQQSLWQLSGAGGLDFSGNTTGFQTRLEFSSQLMPWSQGQRNLLRQHHRTRLALLKLLEEQSELRFKAISLYYRLGLLQQQLEGTAIQVELRSRLYEAAVQQQALGNLKLSEVQQALHRKTEAEVQQVSTQAALETARFQASSLGGWDDSSDPLPETSLPETFPQFPDEATLLKTAQEHSSVQEALNQLQEARWQLEEAQMMTFPEVQLSGSVLQGNFSGQLGLDLQKGTLNASVSHQFSAAGEGWKASASLRIPLMGSETADLNLARRKVQEAEIRVQEVQLAQLQNLREEWGKLTSLQGQWRLQTLTLQQAQDTYRLAQTRNAAGLVSEADLIELELGLQKARLSTLETRTDLYLQTLKLQMLVERKNP